MKPYRKWLRAVYQRAWSPNSHKFIISLPPPPSFTYPFLSPTPCICLAWVVSQFRAGMIRSKNLFFLFFVHRETWPKSYRGCSYGTGHPPRVSFAPLWFSIQEACSGLSGYLSIFSLTIFFSVGHQPISQYIKNFLANYEFCFLVYMW